MPHLLIEYTDNVLDDIDFLQLFSDCHNVLVRELPTQLKSCKSRAVLLKNYHVVDGGKANGFAAVTLKAMPGRQEEVLDTVAEKLMEIVKEYFSLSLKKLNWQITVEVTELSKHYKKSVSTG